MGNGSNAGQTENKYYTVYADVEKNAYYVMRRKDWWRVASFFSFWDALERCEELNALVEKEQGKAG